MDGIQHTLSSGIIQLSLNTGCHEHVRKVGWRKGERGERLYTKVGVKNTSAKVVTKEETVLREKVGCMYKNLDAMYST